MEGTIGGVSNVSLPSHADACVPLPGIESPTVSAGHAGGVNGTSDLTPRRRLEGRGSRPFRVRPSRTATHERGPRRRWKAANDYES